MILFSNKREELHLAMVVTARDVFSVEAAEQLAAKKGLRPELLEMVRAGLTYEEVDLFLGGEDGYRYEWRMPLVVAGGEAVKQEDLH